MVMAVPPGELGGRKRGLGPRGSVALVALAFASACGSRTVIGADFDESGESGSNGRNGGASNGGAGGRGGDAGNTIRGGGGGRGGTGGKGGFGGSAAVGGSAGAVAGSAGVAGSVGGVAGSFSGTGGVTGGAAGTGIGGSVGKGGCGASSGTGSGGAAGAGPGRQNACVYLCERFPYGACPADFKNPFECLGSCLEGFDGLDRCEELFVNLVLCLGDGLDPNAMCSVRGGECYGAGCTQDALSRCLTEYATVLECVETPVPPGIPCPPPPDPPPPPGCYQQYSSESYFCALTTFCPNQTPETFGTLCWYDPEFVTWTCECTADGQHRGTVGFDLPAGQRPCHFAASVCGYGRSSQP